MPEEQDQTMGRRKSRKATSEQDGMPEDDKGWRAECQRMTEVEG